MIRSSIFNTKEGNQLFIGDEGQLGIEIHQHPPKGETLLVRPFAANFVNDSDSIDFRVDGSTDTVDFYITADSKLDVYVKTISVIIADSGARLDRYGSLAALTNGTQFIWQTSDLGTTIIQEGIKTNLQFMRSCGLEPAIGTGQDAFKADLSGGGADAYLPYFDLADIFGLQYGLRLRAGTTDRLIFRIRDDLSTGIDQHDARGFGIKF